ncbi:MAG: glutathione-dependent disulfide-bond oxidoreductase [Limnobacter sp.]|nr:glutathione-dependent disulfide-bond oxidoreductase [Limnobacter sp.]
MSESKYEPPKVWTWDSASGGHFSKINRPISGATHEKELPKGEHDFQLYSLATPNGVKVTILLEELIEAGIKKAEYDAWLIKITEGDQFGSGFVEVNPNSKIPAMWDYSTSPPTALFESASIMMYLAEKFQLFLPEKQPERSACLNWLFWQMGSAPFLGGGFGHFYRYAPEKLEYPINRYTMEVKRQLDVLDKALAKSKYIAGDEYTIADMAIWPWYGGVVLGAVYDAVEFLNAESYTHLMRWAKELEQRPAVKRGRMVNRVWGEPHEQVPERHSPADFEGKSI